MDFQQLLAKMNELSQPAPASKTEQPVAECPPAMGMGPSEPMGDMGHSDTPPPSISVNLNAQGLDNIEQLLDLIKAVNPDAKPEIEMPGLPVQGPEIEIEPMDKPAGGLPSLGNLDAGPLKMLPDLDSDEPAPHAGPEGGDIDPMGGDEGGDDVSKAQGDLDNDGDHDMDDHNMEKPGGEEGDDEEEESFGNSLGNSEPETHGVDAAIPSGNDLNKPKQMVKHSYRQGDNPMAMEGEELRAWIKSELTQRLAEAKGAK